MEDLYKTLTEALAAWVKAVTGADVKAAEFRVPRSEGQLSGPGEKRLAAVLSVR